MSFKSGSLCALKFSLIKPSSLMTHQFFTTSCTSLLSNWAEISRRFDALERTCFDPRPKAGRWTLSSFSSIPIMSPNSSSKLSFQKLIKIYFSKFYRFEVLSSLLSDLLIYHDFKVRLICYEHVHYLESEYSLGRVLRDRGLQDSRALIGWKWHHRALQSLIRAASVGFEQWK